MLIEVKENRMETEKRKLFLLMNKKASTEIRKNICVRCSVTFWHLLAANHFYHRVAPKYRDIHPGYHGGDPKYRDIHSNYHGGNLKYRDIHVFTPSLYIRLANTVASHVIMISPNR